MKGTCCCSSYGGLCEGQVRHQHPHLRGQVSTLSLCEMFWGADPVSGRVVCCGSDRRPVGTVCLPPEFPACGQLPAPAPGWGRRHRRSWGAETFIGALHAKQLLGFPLRPVLNVFQIKRDVFTTNV